jgi:hypothetical protein
MLSRNGELRSMVKAQSDAELRAVAPRLQALTQALRADPMVLRAQSAEPVRTRALATLATLRLRVRPTRAQVGRLVRLLTA